MIAFYAKHNGLSVYQELKRSSLSVIGLSSWSDIEQHASNNSLFTQVEDEEHKIFDYSGLNLTKSTAEYFGLLPLDSDVYCINRDKTVLNAADKKIVKTKNSAVEELKNADKTNLKNMIDEALEIEKFSLAQLHINKIIQESQTYDDAMNLLYAIMMSEEPEKVFVDYQKIDQPELFMLSWREHSLASDTSRWYSTVKPDELQYALSILMTKTLKWSPSEKRNVVINELIALDSQLKVFVRSEMTAFHSVLWKLMWV